MQDIQSGNSIDTVLLESFKRDVLNKVPHIDEMNGKGRIINPTPLVDITADRIKCAREE